MRRLLPALLFATLALASCGGGDDKENVQDLLDKAFDPNLADAVAHEPGEGGETIVAEVLRSGYLWNGRTLRPAMVRTRD